MNIFLDTNILLNVVRAKNADAILKFINPDSRSIYSSVVVEAEARSIAIRNNWGADRLIRLDFALERMTILEITQSFLHTYVEIDTYSQRQNPNFTEYAFETPRNMGKNDLWIAATAGLLGLELITTDADFAHLHNVFLDIRQINPDEFRPFF